MKLPTSLRRRSLTTGSCVRRLAGFAAALCLALLGAAGPAHAAASAWFDTQQGGVRLVAATNAVGDRRTLSLGVEFRMKPGWKIYWRSPGDAGFPPQIDWTGSHNLKDAALNWPAPLRFSVLGLETLGYHDKVVLPVAAESAAPGQPVKVRAHIRYLTCENLCIPYETTLALALPAGPATPAPEAAEIARFATQVPKPAGSEGLDVTDASLTPPAGQDDVRTLRVAVRSDAPFGRPDLYVEGPPGYTYAAPSISYAPDRKRAVMRVAVAPPANKPAPIAGAPLTFTLVDGARAIEAKLTPAPAPAAPAETPELVMAGGFLAALALALLGGLILNLMPCVLPVLSIKLLAVVGHAGGEARQVRRGFAASAAGIVVSFLVLGSVAVGLRAAGMAAEWGLQFQQPAFLAVMVLIVALFAGNLWGLYEIRLPGFVADRAAAAGQHRPGLAGHFFAGALATLLATPCSAPFLGTAIGFALSRGPVEIYAIFSALGLGLALPYLLVATFPRIATHLPHPGRWMIHLKRALGVALAGTAAWLAFVLASLAGADIALAVAALGVAALGVVAALRRRSAAWHRAGWGAVGTLGAAAVAVTIWAGPAAPARPDVATGPWQRFDLAAIADEVRLGRVVVVDVTADWCLTCKVNKRVVLDAQPVKGLIAAQDVTAMLADWTRPDPTIARYLATFGRYGIPFTAVYGPGLPQGVALPELLTPSAVADAIAKARGSGAAAARGRDKDGRAS